MDVQLLKTEIPEVKLIETTRFSDDRGFFMESFHKQAFDELGIPSIYLQDNHSRSNKDVLRGIHYQDISAPMGKLVRCTVGEIIDVAVDLRSGSPTFGKFVKEVLSDANNRLLYIPEGFGHAFLSLSDRTDVMYKCTGLYSPSSEGTVLWNDPQLGIDWGLEDPIVSDKDRSGKTLEQYLEKPAFVYQSS